MNITSDKLNCYIEGIRFPLERFDVTYAKNSLSQAQIRIPIGNDVHPKLWSNALIQVTYTEEKREKLLYQGLISSMNIVEDHSFIHLYVDSIFSVFNLNTTLDYVAPKKYGINNIASEIKVHIGNEITVERDNSDSKNFYLSNRYFFLPDNYRDKTIEEGDVNSYKLEYIIDRTPLAEKFAFSFFENIVYNNFLLSKPHIERLNLLNKTESLTRIEKFEKNIEKTVETTAFFLDLDQNRTGFAQKMKIKSVNNLGTGTTITASYTGLTDEFKNAVKTMSGKLGIEPDWIMAVMNFETGGTFSPSIKNKTGSGGIGLIQFMPDTAVGLGTTTEKLAAMTQIEQLKYVEKHLNTYNGRMKNLEDVCAAVFFPTLIGKPDAPIPEWARKGNGDIKTVKDYVRKVIISNK